MIKNVLEKAKEEGIALTFDDVRLRTGYSKVLPDDVSVESKFSKHVGLKIPIVSAAMDTVTESSLAITLAKLGGLGIIHRSLSIEKQAKQVARVKHHLNALIRKPICVYEDESISSVLDKIKIKAYNFHSFPVLSRNNKLIGILAGNDFEFCDNPSLFVRDVMTVNPLVAPEGTTMEEAYEIMKKHKKKLLPLANVREELIGLYTFSDVKRTIQGNQERYNLDERGHLRVGAAIGVGEESLERVDKLVKENIDVVVIDTAHADTESVIETLKQIKQSFPILDVVVGNVSIPESAQRLIDAGADGIKVGQGPGSICTTRIIAGIGRPQISAVYECVKIAEQYDVPVCADGGLKNSGDIPIAIAAGASSVMMGSMLAGVEEAPGEIVFFQGRQWKSYRGMGSLGAMQESKSSRERYLQGKADKDLLIPEGVEGLIPYKGKLADVIFQYVGGLRRGMGYVGADSIKELQEKAEFDRITTAGFSESHPHDVQITKESPNYKTN